MTDIEELKKKILNYPNVQAVGHGKPEGERHDEDITLIAYVTGKVSETDLSDDELIPKELEGVTIDVQDIGNVSAELEGNAEPQEAVENSSVDTTRRQRPAPHGISVGHKDITAGTAGLVLWDEEEFEGITYPVPKTVSNNHVYANVNNAEIGDPIYQPGPHDGGSSDDKVAELEDYVELKSEGNYVDMAWADIDGRTMNSYIPTVGVPTNTSETGVGQILKKFGRTTAEQSADVLSADATVRVNFGDSTRVFEDQILTKSMSAGGDSGSAVVNMKGDFVGLLFAGSDKVTVVNKAEHVLNESGLHLNPQDVYN